LVILRVCVGSLLRWIFFFDYYEVCLTFTLKLVTLVLCLLGVLLRLYIIKNRIFLVYYRGEFLGSIWFINIIYLWIYKPINEIGNLIFISDKTWMELIRKNIILFLIKHFKVNFYYNIYIFIFIFIYLYLLVNFFY
jgi:hypothetical protein